MVAVSAPSAKVSPPGHVDDDEDDKDDDNVLVQ